MNTFVWKVEVAIQRKKEVQQLICLGSEVSVWRLVERGLVMWPDNDSAVLGFPRFKEALALNSCFRPRLLKRRPYYRTYKFSK